MSIKPPLIKQLYNHRLHGVYGQFGTGAGVRAFYLQSILTPDQLDWVSLISDISGSEQWPVRDLFQRDIDNERITESLLPYLQDEEKIKFFNPLTLTLLPMEENSGQVLRQMPRMIESSANEDGNEWDFIERKNYHRIGWVKDNPQFARLEWNDIRTRLVAIDGQHRLSALKRFRKDNDLAAHQGFMKWHIPIVIVSFRVGEGGNEPPSVLEVVRSIFIYINTEAKEVNRARAILLSDESVNAVCAQELVQVAHSNDVSPQSKYNPDRLPLLFYDWRGEDSEKQHTHAPASVKGVEEIYYWFERYILGEDFDAWQATALDIDLPHPLHKVFHDKKLTYTDSDQLRELIKKDLLPAVSYLLENFKPYRSYINALRELENKHLDRKKSDLARHAFHELRFGTNHAPESIKLKVKELLSEIKGEIEDQKRNLIHEPINRDIGMRGVVCAFGELYWRFGYPGWVEYAKWFVQALNLVYDKGWIDRRSRAKRRSFLLHVVEDHSEEIVNYRLEDVKKAFGAYLQLLITAYGQPLPETWRADDWPAIKETLLDEDLGSQILRGYKKQVRAEIKQDYPEGGRPLTEAVNQEAEKRKRKQIRRFERELDKIESTVSGQ